MCHLGGSQVWEQENVYCQLSTYIFHVNETEDRHLNGYLSNKELDQRQFWGRRPECDEGARAPQNAVITPSSHGSHQGSALNGRELYKYKQHPKSEIINLYRARERAYIKWGGQGQAIFLPGKAVLRVCSESVKADATTDP